MDTDKYSLIAFVALLISIVRLTGIGAASCALARPYEALGLGATVSGLIGMLGTFRPTKPGTAIASAETVDTGSPAPGQQSTTRGERHVPHHELPHRVPDRCAEGDRQAGAGPSRQCRRARGRERGRPARPSAQGHHGRHLNRQRDTTLRDATLTGAEKMEQVVEKAIPAAITLVSRWRRGPMRSAKVQSVDSPGQLPDQDAGA